MLFVQGLDDAAGWHGCVVRVQASGLLVDGSGVLGDGWRAGRLGGY